MMFIYWGLPGQDKKKYKGRLEVMKISEVVEGKGILKNPFCRALIKDYSGRKSKMISIVSKERTLELEAPTIESAQVWIGYFRLLFKLHWCQTK